LWDRILAAIYLSTNNRKTPMILNGWKFTSEDFGVFIQSCPKARRKTP
jgi:hypothetical protein